MSDTTATEAPAIEDAHVLVRVRAMLHRLGQELGEIDLDAAATRRVAHVQRQCRELLERALGEPLRNELSRFTHAASDEPGQVELMIDQSLMASWLDGLTNGMRLEMQMASATAISAPTPLADAGPNPVPAATGLYL